jgi:hypothetical protein
VGGAGKRSTTILSDISVVGLEERCDVCNRAVLVMAFKGSGACCGRCRDLIGSTTLLQVPERGHNSITDPPEGTGKNGSGNRRRSSKHVVQR